MGFITLIVLAAVELFFMIWSIRTKEQHRQERGIIRISELLLLIVLLAAGVLEWGFRYYVITLVLFGQSVHAAVALIKNKVRQYKLSKAIYTFIMTVVLYTGALFIAIVCPQYTQPVITGNYDVSMAKYTWTDESRVDPYARHGEKRSLTVEFWYPENADEKCPLVVFSHGAFGFSGSNRSTFEELASNGYVVASIGHTYQAFFTVDTDEKLTTVDMEFLNTAVEIQNGSFADEFSVTHDWLKIRTDDENFVIDTILREAASVNRDTLFSLIDTDKTGLFGHSLGGASSAQLGRQRDDIDAVIVLDGTMIGEKIAPVDGEAGLNNTPYPVPLLNIYAEDHYTNAIETAGDEYENFYASRNALNAEEVIISGAGHLNFTDLPLFSPFLAKMLGVGEVDARYCIETANQLILEYFNCHLKGMAEPHFEKEY